jgi:hypothetical protein
LPITLETTVDGIVQTHAGEVDDTEFLRLVIGAILAEPDPVKLLTPMLRGYLMGRKRAIVRAVEHTTWRAVDITGAEAIAAGNPLMAARLQPLLDEMIHIPGVGNVRWGDATVDQLTARAAMYGVQRDALDKSIADIRAAIRLIETQPGATCLNDIYRQE